MSFPTREHLFDVKIFPHINAKENYKRVGQAKQGKGAKSTYSMGNPADLPDPSYGLKAVNGENG
jgi:hypothetical protein